VATGNLYDHDHFREKEATDLILITKGYAEPGGKAGGEN